jgi:hypothetical protein
MGIPPHGSPEFGVMEESLCSLYDVEFDVGWDWEYEPEVKMGWDEPPHPARLLIYIRYIKRKGVDIMKRFSQESLDEIENQLEQEMEQRKDI